MSNLGDGQKLGWGNGALTPEDAERFAQMFRPSWELDDAPFAASSPDDTIADVRSLEKGGANPDVRATLSKETLLMPPPASAAPRSSAAQKAAMNATMPLAQVVSARPPSAAAAVNATAIAPASRAPSARPHSQAGANTRSAQGVNVAGARTRREAYVTDDLLVPRKSKAGLFAGIAVAALVAVGGIGALVMMSSGSKEDAPVPAPVATTTAAKVEAHPVPPPPPPPEPAAATTTAAPIATHAPPPPAPDTPPTTAKPSPPPPPPVAASPPPRPASRGNSGGSSQPSKPRSGGGSTIVHDVPF